MDYFDLHIHSAFSEGTSNLEQLASTAKTLGYKGICFVVYFDRFKQLKKLEEEIEKTKKKIGIEIYLGFEALDEKELMTLANNRRKFDVLLVNGGDLKLNRAAVETPQVDILTHPEYKRFDSGLNHVLAKAAAKNNVAIEVNFREILITNKKSRSTVIANISKNVKLASKYRAPVILCSGVLSHFEIKDPLCLISMGTQVGLSLKGAKEAISKIPQIIINQSRERSQENWVMPGVKVIK